VAHFDQLEDVEIGDGLERGWGFQYKHGFFLYFGQKKALHFHVRPVKNWGYKFNASISVAMFDYSIPQ
jgi:hypothetical protein